MGMREDAIANLKKKSEKNVPEMGSGNPDADGMTPAPMAPSVKKSMKPKKKAAKKGSKASIADPMYDEMHRERARERHEMKMAEKLKETEMAKKKRAMKAAMGK